MWTNHGNLVAQIEAAIRLGVIELSEMPDHSALDLGKAYIVRDFATSAHAEVTERLQPQAVLNHLLQLGQHEEIVEFDKEDLEPDEENPKLDEDEEDIESDRDKKDIRLT